MYSFSLYAASGKCGNDVTWYLNEQTGVLTISGSGAMWDWDYGNKSPWKGNISIKKVIINSGISTIGSFAFYECKNIESVSIPYSIIAIHKNAFSCCRGLTAITIPNTVTSIGDYAFTYCVSLSSVFIPYSVKTIGEKVFSALYETSKLTSIVVDKNNQYYCDIDGVLYNKSKTAIICFPKARLDISYEIPYGVTTIQEGAFFSCENIESIILPSTIRTIGDEAFHGCKKLTSINLPQGLTSIGWQAFGDCPFESIDIPNGVTSIGAWAFGWCGSLTSVTLPNTISRIKEYTFAYCPLTTVVIPNSVRTIEEKAFAYSGMFSNPTKEFYYPRGLDISKAGVENETKLIAYDPNNPPKVKPAQPPILSFIEGSLAFDDTSKNNRIDANENSKIKFKIKNNGKGAAQNCEVRVKLSGTKSGISAQNVKLPLIAAGQTYDVSVPVTSNVNTQDGNVTISIEVYEPNGFGISSMDVNIATKAFIPPYIQVVNYNVSSPSGEIRRMEAFTLAVTLQNVKYGDAEDVRAKINLPSNIFLIDGKTELSYPSIKAGEKKRIELNLLANNNYLERNIPISIDIKEKYGKYAENKELNFELVQQASPTTNIIVKEEKETFRIVSSKDMALAIAGTPRISVLTNTSVSILRPEWYNTYHNPQNFKSPFPYAVIQLELKGDKEAIDLAKERLSLVMGGKHIVEAKDSKESNTIYFLVHCRNEYIDLDCGDGCEPINIWKERLEPNKVYYGSLSISIQ